MNKNNRKGYKNMEFVDYCARNEIKMLKIVQGTPQWNKVGDIIDIILKTAKSA